MTTQYHYLTFSYDGAEHQVVFETDDDATPLDDMVHDLARAIDRSFKFKEVRVRVPSFEDTYPEVD